MAYIPQQNYGERQMILQVIQVWLGGWSYHNERGYG
jgi:hypothetical protein